MTPLSQYIRAASPEERDRTAKLAGTSVGYLYQLAGCHSKNPSAALAVGIEQATRTVAADSEGRLTPVSVSELVTMCAARVFEREGA